MGVSIIFFKCICRLQFTFNHLLYQLQRHYCKVARKPCALQRSPCCFRLSLGPILICLDIVFCILYAVIHISVAVLQLPIYAAESFHFPSIPPPLPSDSCQSLLEYLFFFVIYLLGLHILHILPMGKDSPESNFKVV